MSLFQQLNQNNHPLNSIIQMFKGNPQSIINSVMQDPRYQQWKTQNYGKTPEQICQENGIDFNILKNLQV